MRFADTLQTTVHTRNTIRMTKSPAKSGKPETDAYGDYPHIRAPEY